MSNRLVDLYPVGTLVEVLFRQAGPESWTPETWVAGAVVRHAYPGVWVETARGARWFVTNGTRIRRCAPPGASTSDTTIHKIEGRDAWAAAVRDGRYLGSAADLRDGFIHFSTAAQVRATAAKHFAGRDDLLLLDVAVARLDAAALRWEPARDGSLFPHLYAPLLPGAVIRVRPLPRAADGSHEFPGDVPA
ncbi:MAG: DUF952 domain-containing protein [Planctomycetes bacterium]|nr:DUF952 domain-containing protein [Planctomycetota bacterium]